MLMCTLWFGYCLLCCSFSRQELIDDYGTNTVWEKLDSATEWVQRGRRFTDVEEDVIAGMICQIGEGIVISEVNLNLNQHHLLPSYYLLLSFRKDAAKYAVLDVRIQLQTRLPTRRERARCLGTGGDDCRMIGDEG